LEGKRGVGSEIRISRGTSCEDLPAETAQSCVLHFEHARTFILD
jgi:hypothetical protein